MEIDNKKLIKVGILTVIIIIADFFAYTKAIPFILEISKVSYGNINLIKTILPLTEEKENKQKKQKEDF